MTMNPVRRAFVFSLIALVTTFSSGCAAGNFGFTRSVAKWNLRFSLLPRILFYILFVIIPVYPIALLLDLVLNNTIEFWSGKAVMTAQNQTFQKDGYRVEVAHSADPLRKTVMTAYDQKGGVVSVVELRETSQKMVELYVDNVKKAEASNSKSGIIELLNFQDSLGKPVTKQEFELQEDSFHNVKEDIQRMRRLVQTTPAKPLGSLAANFISLENVPSYCPVDRL